MAKRTEGTRQSREPGNGTRDVPEREECHGIARAWSERLIRTGRPGKTEESPRGGEGMMEWLDRLSGGDAESPEPAPGRADRGGSDRRGDVSRVDVAAESEPEAVGPGSGSREAAPPQEARKEDTAERPDMAWEATRLAGAVERVETVLAGQADMPARIGTAIGVVVGEALAGNDRAMAKRLEELAHRNAGFHYDLTAVLRENFRILTEAVPKLEAGQVGEVVLALNELRDRLRVNWTDSEREGVPDGSRGGRLAKRALAAVAPALLVLGVLVQHELGVTATVLGVDDATRWKNHQWDSHGERIARCFEEALWTGVDVSCPVVVRAPTGPVSGSE